MSPPIKIQCIQLMQILNLKFNEIFKWSETFPQYSMEDICFIVIFSIFPELLKILTLNFRPTTVR
jgi:hypothetical protein